MITTVTLNPMLDKTISIHALRRGMIERASRMDMVPGGKGVNVSRQLHRLGIETTATGFLGGDVGKTIMDLIEAEGYRQEFVQTKATTREGLTFLEKDGTQTAVFEPSPDVEPGEAETLRQTVASLAERSSWVVCSGSSPGSNADDIFYEAIQQALTTGCSCVLDSYGTVFARGLKAVPTLVKTNKSEFEQSLKIPLSGEGDIRSALRQIRKDGVRFCVLTDGNGPVYASSGDGEWKVTPPAVKPVNPVGSGDAMLAGMLYGFVNRWEFERCLRFGVAAGAANASVWAVANSSFEEITKLEPTVGIEKLG